MGWRLQLSNLPVRRLDIIQGRPTMLAAWTSPTQVHFFDLQHGTSFDPLTIAEPVERNLQHLSWGMFAGGLKAPNGGALPYVRAERIAVWSGADGRVHLLRDDEGFVVLSGSVSRVLPVDSPSEIRQVAMDRTGSYVTLLDREGSLHLYARQVRTGIFPGIEPDPEVSLSLAVTDSGISHVRSGRVFRGFDSAGQNVFRFEAHYEVGSAAWAPDGRLLAVHDQDSDVFRVYGIPSATLLYQAFATDLLADARRAQLLPVATQTGASVGATALSNKGALAFATLGLICVTSVHRMKAVSKPG